MKETEGENTAGSESDAVWPPPPVGHAKQITSGAAPTAKHYLTNRTWLDAISGIGMGLLFQWLAFYSAAGCVQFLIPRKVDYFWNVVVSCCVALLVLLI